MKKVFYSIALMMVAVFSSVLLTGCGDPAPEILKIKADSVQTSIVVNDSFNTDGLKVVVTYDDGTIETVGKNNDMTISSIDTSKTGEQTLTVSYLGLTATLKINVYATYNDKEYQIYGYRPSEAFGDYLSRKEKAGGVNFKDASKDNFFAKNDSTYKVGDDNPFKFFPRIDVMSKTDPTNRFKITEGSQFTSIVTVREKLKGQSSFHDLTGNDLTAKVAIDALNSTYDFTEQAIGNIYQITVQPEQMTAASTYDPITIEVEVVNGWNVYDEENLSRIDNGTTVARNDEQPSGQMWQAFKTANGIGNEEIEAVVLHRDLKLTSEHIPSGYMWGSEAADKAGSLIDAKSIYTRDVPENGKFNIYGNYFTIDSSAIPAVKNLTHDGDFSHAALFSFGGDNNHAPAEYWSQGKVGIYDVYLLGNSQKTQDKEDLKGGLNAIITSANELNFYNSKTRGFVTHILAAGSFVNGSVIASFDTTINIDYTKMIDSYNTMFFAWGSKHNNINNSVLKESGGPLIVATHVGNNTERETYKELCDQMYSNIVVNDSVVSSPVSGSEVWFEKVAPMELAKILMTVNFTNVDTLLKQASELAATNHLNVRESGVKGGPNNGFDFILCSMGSDNVQNTSIINNTIKVNELSETICDSDMNAATLAAYVAMLQGAPFNLDPTQLTAFPFIIEADGVYLTFDLAKAMSWGDPQTGLAILTPQGPLSINSDLFSSGEYLGSPEYKAFVDSQLETFFNADYASIILGGQRMSCTFKMFHEA